MKKIEIKNKWTLKVIHEHTCLGNTLLKTIKHANLEGANLEGADLEGADLKGAYLEGADLEGADLKGAYLKGANLKGANLKGAYLEGANLEGAYLKGANLEGANLKGAYLEGADLEGAYLIQIVGLGSHGRCTTFDIKNKQVICGCWYGSFEDFKKRVEEIYPENSLHRINYLSALNFIESIKPQIQ